MNIRTLRMVGAIVVVLIGGLVVAEERTESFDRDPGWDGRNNRSAMPVKRSIRQDFGYSPTAHAGGQRGEMGGFVGAAAEPSLLCPQDPRADI